MDNELLYCGHENETPCSYYFLYLSIFLSFNAKFVSKFSPELRKVESLNIVYIYRMSDCIVGLRLRVMALILQFLSIFIRPLEKRSYYVIPIGIRQSVCPSVRPSVNF